MFKVPNEFRNRTHPVLASVDLAGNSGLFQMKFEGYEVNCIASEGAGFEHVSVTINRKRTPSWEVMNFVKDLFWEEEDVVVQFHPPKSQYVNCHQHCLHMWSNEQVQSLMLPNKTLIG